MNNDYMIEHLQQKIEKLEERITVIEKQMYPWVPEPEELPNRCPNCKIDFTGTMGYVCNRTDCPMQAIVTCGNTGG